MSYPPGPGYPPRINNNLVWAILATLFCCWPLGIVAIVKAAQVDGLLARGDYYGAQAAADSAKRWSIWSALSIVILGVIGVVIAVIAAIVDSGSTSY